MWLYVSVSVELQKAFEYLGESAGLRQATLPEDSPAHLSEIQSSGFPALPLLLAVPGTLAYTAG